MSIVSISYRVPKSSKVCPEWVMQEGISDNDVCFCQSVGFLVHDGEINKTIAMSLSCNEHDNILVIPVTAITKITYLITGEVRNYGDK